MSHIFFKVLITMSWKHHFIITVFVPLSAPSTYDPPSPQGLFPIIQEQGSFPRTVVLLDFILILKYFFEKAFQKWMYLSQCLSINIFITDGPNNAPFSNFLSVVGAKLDEYGILIFHTYISAYQISLYDNPSLSPHCKTPAEHKLSPANFTR